MKISNLVGNSADFSSFCSFKRLLQVSAVAAFSLAVIACSSGSGQQGVQNLPPEPDDDQEVGDVVEFVGAIKASTDDVLRFEQNLWANVASPNRCGACHVEDGQSPQFARGDDINLAYTAANSIVDLNDPAASRMVAKVATGHGCWTQSSAFCEERVTGWITSWAAESGVEILDVSLERPQELRDVSASLSFPDDSSAFATHVYPTLNMYCKDCHRADAPQSPVQPYFASSNLDVAYEAAQSKMLFNTTQTTVNGETQFNIDASASRLVVRLREEAHNCWDNNCAASAAIMEQKLEDFAATMELRELDASLVASKAMRIGDGTIMSSNGRIENNAIAIYKFKAGQGTVANDFSEDFGPQMDLTLHGDVEWVSNWGVRFNNGRLQAPTSTSSKLHKYITQTGEYSIEAWVVPANVTQDGPSRIVSYSASNNERNFMLGQTLYNYNFANRSSNTDVDGAPMLTTADAREALQATLQHVVVNFDPFEGRSIFVNGSDGSNAEQNLAPFAMENPDIAGGGLQDWDDSYAFILGNETSGEYPWRGTIRFLAIHNRVLSAEDIMTNYEAGVGQKILVAFSVADHIADMSDAYIVFLVEQFDDYSYLFSDPYFFSFTETPPTDVVIRGMRIGVNGREAPIGQAFANLDYRIAAGSNVQDETPFSSLGAVIPLEKGPEQDEFFLSFDQIGTSTHQRAEEVPSPPSPPQDILGQPDIGVRTFAEINASLSAMTGVPVTEPGVTATFEAVKQQMPSVEDVKGFLVAHQMGITQLAVKYCNTLANDSARSSAFFPGFSNNTFDTSGRQAIADALLKALVAHNIPGEGGLINQPDVATAETTINSLIDTMTASCPAGVCSNQVTVNTITATCAATLGSAVMLVQ